MLRRRLLYVLRYPSLTLTLLGMPIVFLLLFVYVFGGTLGDGLGGESGGRDALDRHEGIGPERCVVVRDAEAACPGEEAVEHLPCSSSDAGRSCCLRLLAVRRDRDARQPGLS